MKLKLYRSTEDQLWYFRIVGRNGKIVVQGEGYKRIGAAVKMLRHLLAAARDLRAQIDAEQKLATSTKFTGRGFRK